MQLSYHFQNIVKISLSHFFWTISHDIYLISTYTESSYWCLLVKLFLDESGTKSQNIPPISDHSLERIGSPKNYNIRVFLPIVASRRNTLLEKNAIFDAFKISCISCDNRIKTQNIV